MVLYQVVAALLIVVIVAPVGHFSRLHVQRPLARLLPGVLRRLRHGLLVQRVTVVLVLPLGLRLCPLLLLDLLQADEEGVDLHLDLSQLPLDGLELLRLKFEAGGGRGGGRGGCSRGGGRIGGGLDGKGALPAARGGSQDTGAFERDHGPGRRGNSPVVVKQPTVEIISVVVIVKLIPAVHS